jgi:hypothetical protein
VTARDSLTRKLEMARRTSGILVEPWRWEGQQLEDAIREVREDLQDLADALGAVEESARGER